MEEKTGFDMEAVAQPSTFTYDNMDVRKLVRKIDWRLMPFLWGYAVLSAVDVRFPGLHITSNV